MPLGDSVSGLVADIAPLDITDSAIALPVGGAIFNGPMGYGPAPNGGNSSLFTAASNHYIVSRHAYFPTGSFTVGGFSYKTSSGGACIVAQASGGGGYTFYLRTGSNSGFRNGGGSFQEVAGGEPSLNVWHQIFMTYDGATLRFYVDGVQTASAGASGTPQPNTSEGVTVGRIGSNNSDYWPGYLDGIRVYNRCLSVEEIQALFAEPYAGVFDFPANLVASTSASANVNLGGVSATAAVGLLSVGGTSSVALTGVSAAAAAGTLSATAGATVALVGVQATSYASDVTPVTDFLCVPMITIMNGLPIPVTGDMTDDEIPVEGDLPYQLAFEGVINTTPIPMSGTLSAVPVPAEGSVP